MSLEPSAQQPTLDTYDLPYSVPTDAEDGACRVLHRKWYWSRHDYDDYSCPDCGRGAGRVYQFDVHHKDGDPKNGHPDNLIGLCRRCHIWRHRKPTISGLDVEEWKAAFVGGGSQ
jgi:hypothetical protein